MCLLCCVLCIKYNAITESDNNSSGENANKQRYIFILTFIRREIIEHKSLYLVQWTAGYKMHVF